MRHNHSGATFGTITLLRTLTAMPSVGGPSKGLAGLGSLWYVVRVSQPPHTQLLNGTEEGRAFLGTVTTTRTKTAVSAVPGHDKIYSNQEA